MNIFGKKKEVAMPANAADALWEKHAALKAQKYALGKELAEVEAKLLSLHRSRTCLRARRRLLPMAEK